MVEFYRKIDPTANISISSIYPDMYLGKQEKAKLGGSKFERSFLTRMTLPNAPTYGSADLKRMDMFYYIDSLDIASNIYQFPEAVIYKTENSERLDINEGIQSINQTKTDDVVIFTSHIEDFSSIVEDFSGVNDAGADQVKFEPVSRAIVKDSQLYITPTDLYKKGRTTTWGGYKERNDYTISEMETNYAYPNKDYGIQGLSDESLIIPMKATGKDIGWKGDRTCTYKAEPKQGKNKKTVYIRHKDRGLVKNGNRDTVPNNDTYGDEITPSNSIFDICRGANEYFGEVAKGESGVKVLGTGALRFSTETKLTGAQSGEMYAWWDKDAHAGTGKVNYARKGTYALPSTGASTAGPLDRQEVMICKKFMPFPMKHPAKPSKRGNVLLQASQDANDFANNLEIDINIKALGEANTSALGSTIRTFKRAFVICFSEEPPQDDEGFFEFVMRHRDTEEDSDTNAALHEAATTNDGTVKSFSAVSFHNDPTLGVCLGQPGLWTDTGSFDGQHNTCWNYDNANKDIIVGTSQFGSTAVNVLDRWIRLNFLFAPIAYGETTTRNGGDPNPRFQWNNSNRMGAGAASHCTMIMSDPSDGTIIPNGAGGVNANSRNYFELNNIIQEYSTKNHANWPSHLSIWLMNYNGSDSRDQNSQVFIDKIAWKDFNYEIKNPNACEANASPDKIDIAPGTGFVGPDGIAQDPAINDKISGMQGTTPTIMSIGTKNPKYLGRKAEGGSDVNRKPWTSDQTAAIMFHGFSSTGLATLEEIPDANIIATYSHGGGDEISSGSDVHTPRTGMVNTCHYGLGGFMHSSLNIGALHVNSFEQGGATPIDPQVNIGLKDVGTGMIVTTGATVSAGNSIALQPDGSVDSALGLGQRMHSPIRSGDTVIIGAGDDSDTTTPQVSTVVSCAQGGNANPERINITLADNVTINTNDNVYIRPQGLVQNFSSKGTMLLDLASAQAAEDKDDAWAQREAGPVSARILEISEAGGSSAAGGKSQCIVKVDTVEPLLLEDDEEYVVYLYGAAMAPNWFSRTTGTDTNTLVYLDNTPNAAKSGLKIEDIDRDSKQVTFSWDGLANDGSTVLLKYENAPFLMVSPYRYWIHMNIDCSKHDGSNPTGVLPGRSYETFSMMDHDFAFWDGVSYHTGTLAEPLNATETAVTVSSASGMTAGESIMITNRLGQDEVMYIKSISGAELQVIRGSSGTYDGKPNTKETSTTPDHLTRTGYAHDNGSSGTPASPYNKIKNVTCHAAWGERLTGDLAKLNTGGTLGTLAARQNLGTTYKETIINYDTVSGVNGAYVNNWLPTVIEEGGVYETKTDFGFGQYKPDDDTGGFIAKGIFKTGQYNRFKMYDINASDEFDLGNQMDLLLKFKDDTMAHVATINTRHTTNPPFALAVFNDDVPGAPKLEVKPNEDDAFLPEFNWTSEGDDLWYGLLFISDKQIDTQYDNICYHIPLNEDVVDDAFGSIKMHHDPKLGTYQTASAGTFNQNFEGLGGFCKDFDGTSDYLRFTSTEGFGVTGMGEPVEEATLVAHIIPDAAPSSGSAMIVQGYISGYSFNDYSLYLDTAKRVNLKVYTGGTEEVHLQTSAIAIDGETPTSIIWTFDKNLKAGNLKLYINGKIEDQSGLVLPAGTTNNWLYNRDITSGATFVYVGCGANTGGTLESFYNGKIEEIAYYRTCLYPVVPSDSKFIFTKPIQEVSNYSPKSYSAKLFIKDYHNIRGKTTQEVATSSPVSWRKAGFRLEAS